MEIKPKLTVSGYRGIWGESLTPVIAENYTKAFIRFVKENIKNDPIILLGRDGRESGPEIKKIIIKTLNSLGIKFIDGDILPTPTVLYAVHKHKYDSAIIITASHNPREYNGLKFVTDRASFTNEKEVEIIKDNYEKEIKKNNNDNLPNLSNQDLAIDPHSDFNFCQEHADQILANLDVEIIKSKKYKVAVDMINASACVLDPYLFEKLGVELVPINNIPDGNFAHKPEPLRENLKDVANLVKEKNCSLGFAHDPDADRLVVINELGEVIFEEYTLALGIEAVMSKPENKGRNIVINMSSSQINRDIALRYDGQCIRSKVGEANVVAGIIDNNAIIGGEGGGAIIYPTMNMARDSFVSLALILELLAKRNQTVSECIASLPKYEMRKERIVWDGDMNLLYADLKKGFSDVGSVNILDGIRFDWNDSSWIHIRRSNTEPKMWIISEARDQKRIDDLFEKAKSIINNIK
jgi:phosphomannomutase